MRFAAAVTALAFAVVPTAHAASTPEQPALTGIAAAVAAGRLPSDEAAADRAVVNRAARLWKRLPAARGNVLKAVLLDVGAVARTYDEPRAAALFGMLKENADYLATHPLLGRSGQDIADADGVVYRYFPGHGFQFHPLGNFGALNAAVASGDQERTRRLADALLARAVPTGAGGLVWEYYFRFSGGRPPWTSGMAQAVAAQALARASQLLDDPALATAASEAYRAIPGRLDRQLPAGPWIRLYSFNTLVVLNAQLQSVISLLDYSAVTGDTDAKALATRMRVAVAAKLGEFDTGFWSRYALPSDDSPLDYHLYVVSLLKRLGSQDPRFAAAATRFLAYTHQPPAFKLADPSGGSPGVLFWLSKPGSVTVQVGSGRRRLSLSDGWHRVSWSTGARARLFAVHLAATDYAGNSAAVDALPLVRAALAGRTPAAVTVGQPAFEVGAGLDSPAQAQAATAAGFDTVRLVVPWQPGETVPPSAAGAQVVELAAAAPPDDAARAQLAAFAAALAPGLRELIVSAASSDEATLAAVYDAVKAVAPQVRVAGSIADASALAQLGAAFKASGRFQPVMDELAYDSATLPDYGKLVAALGAAFDGSAQPGSALPVLYAGVGVGTTIPPSKASLYSPDALDAKGVGEASQGSTYAGALHAAACQPTAAGILFDRLADGPAPGAQDGLLYPDLTPKAGLATLKPALDQARQGILAVCPGLAVPAAASALVFPEQTATAAGASAWSVQLGCVRDCLYLVTLERSGDGAPMLARRGALRAGAAPATVRLPALPVPAGSYRLVVRLVTQVNPGAIFTQQSDPIAAG
jgi:hypothetical protein